MKASKFRSTLGLLVLAAAMCTATPAAFATVTQIGPNTYQGSDGTIYTVTRNSDGTIAKISWATS